MTWQRFSDIRGHSAQIDVLLRICASRHPAHAYLFEGPQGAGKQTVAWALAGRLACLQADGAQEACGQCRSCHALQRGEHPDIALLSRDGANIKIGQVREALKRLRYEAVLGKAKALIIEDADKLREEAANALLKTLEEPTAGTHFILVTSRPQLLLDTIRSRVQVLRFGGLSSDDLRALLVAEGHSEQHARLAAPLAEGDLGRARTLCDPDLVGVVEDVAAFVLRLDQVTASQAADFVETLTAALLRVHGGAKARATLDREKLAWALDVIRAVLRDVMVAGAGIDVDTLPHAMFARPLSAMAERVEPRDVAAVLGDIDHLEEELVYNPNPRIALQAALVGAASQLRA